MVALGADAKFNAINFAVFLNCSDDVALKVYNLFEFANEKKK